MSEEPQELARQEIGPDEARNIASLAYRALTAFHLNATVLEVLDALFDSLRRFADPQEVSAIEALRVEASDEFGLTPPEVYALPRMAQMLVREWRAANHTKRNKAQASYEARVGVQSPSFERYLGAMAVDSVAEAHAAARRRVGESGGVEAATAGALYLDKVLPGWAAYIEPSSLNLERSVFCILGQLAGKHPLLAGTSGYHSACTRLGLDREQADGLGLNHNTYRPAWRKLIAERTSPDE